ncbi:1-acyl-sn-glycerol-3-phosphate acyltransferase [Vulgatibacter incomptus]|uniref:1-acyl-sn-glycerol-3-phosphate acyltransferase n=1 Tax=Vulgatibacter incomptus TaxID=1391653 RepID=A0A0K1PI67_9BACT|nr:1-acyl-sn-glycerol-3-phosphate acyltransferase [Vulgatibacter incomptus]
MNFLVAANHASHLDMGLVKHALGGQGDNLVALAARDYFFTNRLRRTYFENFTQLIPMNRHGSLRESLELASRSLRQGRNLLIFPEGTRATDGTLKEFKGSLGYLALTNQVGILPIYLEGTYDVLPKGAVLPKGRDLAAHIGTFISYEEIAEAVKGLPRSEQHRVVAAMAEEAVRKLRARSGKGGEKEQEETSLHDAGHAEGLAERELRRQARKMRAAAAAGDAPQAAAEAATPAASTAKTSKRKPAARSARETDE